MNIDFVKAERDDLIKVQSLAKEIWPDTFQEILSAEQIEYMLNWMYDIEKLKSQLQEGHEFFLLTDAGKEIGFAGVEWNFPKKDLLRIHKLYLLPSYQGTGLGKYMILQLEDIVKSRNGNGLHLNVNRFNRAVQFYQNLDFRIIGEEDIDIGNGYLMEDYIMCKKW